MSDSLNILWQDFIYGVLKKRPDIDLTKIPTNLQFKVHYDEQNKVYWMESTDLPDFIVSGKNTTELARHMHETTMVYFDVPTYFARQLNPHITFNAVNPKTKRQEEVNVNYREELDKVLA